MGLDFDPIGLPFLVAGILAWAVGAFAYFSAPWRPTNRWLAVLLAAEGGWVGGTGLIAMADDLATAAGIVGVQRVTSMTMVLFYPLFLAYALDTPLVAPFRKRDVRAALLGLWAVLEVLYFAGPRRWFSSPTYRGADGYFTADPGPLSAAFTVLAVGVLAFGLVASISAFRRAPGKSLSRARSRAFLAAWGLRDAGFVLIVGVLLANAGRLAWVVMVAFVTLGVVWALYVLLIGYGILRHQLFDIDVHFRWTIKQGTVASFLLATFFIAAQLAQGFFDHFFGSRWVMGAIVAGLALFFLSPLQRLGERVSRVLLGRPHSITEAPLDERLDLYAEQLRVAWKDGAMTARERRLLEVARERLGIPSDRATLVERRVLKISAR